MRILAIADEPDQRLWGDRCRELLKDVDLILSAGDLSSSYLSFLTCFTSAPVVYVRGNHDDSFEKKPPEGCLCADGCVVQVRGVRILGLGGSNRYRPDGINMYSEKEMTSRIRSLRSLLRSTGGFDILLTHAPLRGCGDQDDLAHRGFSCFGSLLEKYTPAVMVHGHVHQSYTAWFQRQREYHGIPVINAWSSYVFDLPETPHPKEPTRRGLRRMRKASEI